MLKARFDGLLVPRTGDTIDIQGASPSGLSPQAWRTVKRFLELYFDAAGARCFGQITCGATWRLTLSPFLENLT